MQEAATAEGSRPLNMAQIHNSDWDVSRDTLMKTRASKESWYIVLELRNPVMVLSHYHYTVKCSWYSVSVSGLKCNAFLQVIFDLREAFYAEKLASFRGLHWWNVIKYIYSSIVVLKFNYRVTCTTCFTYFTAVIEIKVNSM